MIVQISRLSTPTGAVHIHRARRPTRTRACPTRIRRQEPCATHPVFTFPNTITNSAFDGWVQERQP